MQFSHLGIILWGVSSYKCTYINFATTLCQFSVVLEQITSVWWLNTNSELPLIWTLEMRPPLFFRQSQCMFYSTLTKYNEDTAGYGWIRESSLYIIILIWNSAFRSKSLTLASFLLLLHQIRYAAFYLFKIFLINECGNHCGSPRVFYASQNSVTDPSYQLYFIPAVLVLSTIVVSPPVYTPDMDARSIMLPGS